MFEWNEAAPLPKAVPIASKPRRPKVSTRWIVVVASVVVGAALMAAGYVLSRSKPQELIVTALTSYPGGENAESFSRRKLRRLHVVGFGGVATATNLGEGGRRRSTSSPQVGPFPELSPAWSPDGREIAFVRPGRGIYIVSPLGGPERQVSPTGFLVKWAPDGRAVLVGDRELGKLRGVFEIDLGTGRRSTVIQPESGAGVSTFAVSPDGKSVPITLAERQGVGDVYVIPRAGGPPRRLTYGYSVPWSITWMPSGREILYSADHTLWRVTVPSGRVANLFSVVRKDFDYPSVSSPAPGRPIRLAFTTQYVEFGLRLIDLRAPIVEGTFQAVKPLADSDSRDWAGHFSKDAKRLTFLSERGGWRPELWVVNSDETGLQQLTRFNAAEVDGGTWSPDGRHVALDASVDGNADIYVVPADGGPPERLSRSPRSISGPRGRVMVNGSTGSPCGSNTRPETPSFRSRSATAR